jgi:hypothetical protein
VFARASYGTQTLDFHVQRLGDSLDPARGNLGASLDAAHGRFNPVSCRLEGRVISAESCGYDVTSDRVTLRSRVLLTIGFQDCALVGCIAICLHYGNDRRDRLGR